MTYLVIDKIGIEEPIECHDYNIALDIYDYYVTKLTRSACGILARAVADRELDPLDTCAADIVSDEPTRYAYSIYNYTTASHIGNVYYGILNGNHALIKCKDGVVIEKYYNNVKIDSQTRYFLTYDSNNNPLEYYTNGTSMVSKYSAITHELLAITYYGNIPANKLSSTFTLGRIVGWSDKTTGLVIEYIKPTNYTSELYNNTFNKLYKEPNLEVKNRFSIISKE